MELSETIHLLGDLLGEVIEEQESSRVFALEERIRSLSKARRSGDPAGGRQLAEQVEFLEVNSARALAAAFSGYFDLVNLAEEHYRVNQIRQRTREIYPHPNTDSIEEAIQQLHHEGVTRDEMAALLNQLHVELVLTAHPTESKRRTVLSKLVRIADILRFMENCDQLPHEMNGFREEIHAEITSLWLTNRSRTDRPSVTDEVRTGLYFVEEIFWEVIPSIYENLNRALSQYYPGLVAPAAWLTLASWMGGDRDGNPNVITEVTAETLRLHRGLAVEKHRKSLQETARWLSINGQRVKPSDSLNAWFESRRPLPSHVAFLEKRYANEPFRLALSLLADDLAQASKDDMVGRLLSREPHEARVMSKDILSVLEEIRQSIPKPLMGGPLQKVMQQISTFGMQSMRLDIREDSARLNATLDEILRALGIEFAFTNLPAEQRIGLLLNLLDGPIPTLAPHPGVKPDTAETWALFQLIRRVREVYGSSLLGPFIISMSHHAADVLAVLLMARWSGCDEGLQIVPLFETVDDLDRASLILDNLFQLPVYQSHLKTCQNLQMVMIGYSDSNKDSGYLASNWALYGGQEAISQVCKKYQVYLTLFHGRGGTIARGGGPANRAIRAQPPGTIQGRFRLTEQGEVIAARYSNPLIAHRHLEQIVSAVILASSPWKDPQNHLDDDHEKLGELLKPRQVEVRSEWRSAMDRMAGQARKKYRQLVYENPAFLQFWNEVTPLDEIKRLTIGSRPTARKSTSERSLVAPDDKAEDAKAYFRARESVKKVGRVDQTSSVDKIRAIPWVFSWMQSRFNLPGWYGLGTGLSANSDIPMLHEMYTSWPFFQVLLDNTEMSLLKADMEIAAIYTTLASNQDTAQMIYQDLLQEYQLTRDLVLLITGHQGLMGKDSVIARSVHLRNPYVDPLNYLQVEMLRRLRSLPDQESQEARSLREVVVITINGIAAGLRNTG